MILVKTCCRLIANQKFLGVSYWVMKTLVCCAVLLSIAAASAFGQDVPKSDPIKGVWKLNVDKSKNVMAIPESEFIAIVSQGSSYKLTFDVKQSNGHNPKYDIVTDMKGGTVKPVNTDGSGTNGSWRITRQGTKAFDMELKSPFGGWTDKYELSSDGKTMTLHRVPSNTGLVGGYIEKDGTVRDQPQYVLVFDRVE
jgi:hypothetical protein